MSLRSRLTQAQLCANNGSWAVALAAAILVLAMTPLRAATTLATIKVGKSPAQVVVNPATRLAYVVNQAGNSVSVIDSVGLTVKRTITVGTGPVAIAVNPPAGLVYVANSGSGTITPINGTNALTAWAVGGTPAALAVDSILAQLYVMDAARKQVEILNATTGALLATIPTTLAPTSMALNIATHALFVACSGSSGAVVVIDGAQIKIATTVTVAAGTTSISVDPATNVVSLVSPTADVQTIINAGNGYSVQTANGESGAKPFATAYFDQLPNGYFLLADNGDGNVFFSDGSAQIGFGNAYFTGLQDATGLATNATTDQFVVVYAGSDAVYLIDLLNPLFNDNYHLLTAGNGVAGAAFDPVGNRLFVSNSTDNTMSVFDVSPSELVDAYEGNGNDTTHVFIDANPATGNIYSLRDSNLYAVNEAAAGAGSTGLSQDSAGVTTISIGSFNSACIAVNSATNKIYLGDDVGGFYVVNGATNKATKITTVPSTANIFNLAVNNGTNQIFALDSANGNLYILDGSSNALLKTITVPQSSTSGIQVDPVRNLAYVTELTSLYVIDPVAGTTTTVPLSVQPIGSVLNPGLNRLYVGANKDVVVVDTSSNTIVTDTKLPNTFSFASITFNPVSGNYYVGATDGATGARHVQEYSATTNALITDFSSDTFPQITGVADIKANPMTGVIYIGSDNGSNGLVATINERSGVVGGVAPLFDDTAHALVMDLGTGLMAAAGTSYTNLFFPTTDVTGTTSVPITVKGKGVSDTQTIATTPLFRTHNTQPTITISATSKFGTSSPDLVPKHAFYQVDGWLGTWKAVTLTAQSGSLTSNGRVKLPALTTGRHILYFFASDGDVATVQAGLATGNSVGNSPVISSVGSVVFTVEK